MSKIDIKQYSFSQLEDIIDLLKTKIRIAVMYAGNKNDPDAVLRVVQNTRPWKSYEVVANDIANALRQNGFKHVQVIPENIDFISTIRKNNIDVVWLNSAGVQGFNPMSHAPAMLEMAGVPYIGHNPLTATVLDNKHHFKRECLSYGIPTGRSLIWDASRGKLDPSVNSRFKTIFAGYYGPFIIKPVSGRASIGVEVVDFNELTAKVEALCAQTHNAVLIEEYFSGKEYCVSVSGPIIYRDGKLCDLEMPFVFSEIERVLGTEEKIFTSMDVKPIDGSRFRILDKSNEDDRKAMDKLRDIARTIYLDFSLRTLVRVDIRADVYGNMFVLEANPKPDLKAFDERVVSLVAAGLGVNNINYEQYIYSLFANRMHYLFLNKSENIGHVLDLLQ